MRFKTISGTEYLLRDVEMQIEATGECPAVGPQGTPVVVHYTGSLARVGVPMTDMMTGVSFTTSEEFHTVEFSSMPVIGQRFTYFHSVWYGCYSTAVEEIEEEDENVG